MELPQVKSSFYHSHPCRSRHFCRQCRTRGDRRFRPNWAKRWETVGGVDFACIPLGLRFDDEPGGPQDFPEPVPDEDLDKLLPVEPAGVFIPPPAAGLPFEKRPRPTLGMAAAWAVAAAAGRWASPETVAARDEVCATCDKAKQDAKGRYCGICGCATYSDERALKNLAAYEENLPGVPGYNPALPAWGCKHPLRGQAKTPGDPSGPKWGWPLPVLAK